jgi:hypothetical protein
MTVIYGTSLLTDNPLWVQLTEADVASLTIQNRGNDSIFVKATVGASAPTSTAGALEYPPNEGDVNVVLADLFPGISGGNRLWAYSFADCAVSVSHAPSTNTTKLVSATALVVSPADNWVELTTADVTRVTFQNVGISNAYIKATVGSVAPTSRAGALTYAGGQREEYALLSDLFPGVPGANRLWAYTDGATAVAISHAASTNRTVDLSASFPFTHARIAHSLNWLAGGVAVASTTDAAFFADAPMNSLTYERWKPTALPATWEYDHTSSQTCDYCCIAAHTMGTNGNSLQVQYWDGATWVNVTSITAITDDSPVFVMFAPTTAERWRISITSGTVPEVGVVKFGRALQMQRPLYGGHAPVTYARQTVLRSNYSETGEFLGRTKLRSLLSTTYSWQHLNAAWVRANWGTLQRAIETEPFWIAWRPSTFGEVAYCQVDAIPIPSNMGIKDYMAVDMTVRARGYD